MSTFAPLVGPSTSDLQVRTACLKNDWWKIEGNNGLQSPVDDLYYGIKVVKDCELLEYVW